jgi:hypothetical protein
VALWFTLGVVALLLLAFFIVPQIVPTRKRRPQNHARAYSPPHNRPPHNRPPPGPAFKVQPKSGDHGFTVLRQTKGNAATRPPARKQAAPPRAPRTGAGGFTYVVNANPTAICKLTGEQVGNCGCDLHRGKV